MRFDARAIADALARASAVPSGRPTVRSADRPDRSGPKAAQIEGAGAVPDRSVGVVGGAVHRQRVHAHHVVGVLLTALCTSLVGTWVVLRGMSFLGEALAHGVLPGIAIAFVLGRNTTVGAFVAALAMVAGSTSSAPRRRCPTTPRSASCSSASSAPPW